MVALPESPFIIVASVSNRTQAQGVPVYVSELVLDIQRVASAHDAIIGRTGLLISSVMAGGRGSEGTFQVRARIRSKLKVSVFGQAMLTDGAGRMQIRIEPGRYAEMTMRLWFTEPGKYLVGASARLQTAWREETKRASEHLELIQLDNRTDWPVTATIEHTDGELANLDPTEFVAGLRRRADAYQELGPAPLATGRSVVVEGRCESEAF